MLPTIQVRGPGPRLTSVGVNTTESSSPLDGRPDRSQIEKSTLDAAKYGFTQKRQQAETITAVAALPADAGTSTAGSGSPEAHAILVGPAAVAGEVLMAPAMAVEPLDTSGIGEPAPKLCRIDDPDCEACQ